MDAKRIQIDARETQRPPAVLTAGAPLVILTEQIPTDLGRFYSFYRIAAGIDGQGWHGRLIVFAGQVDTSAVIGWFNSDPSAGTDPPPSTFAPIVAALELAPPELVPPYPDASVTAVLPAGAGSTVLLPTAAYMRDAWLWGLSGISVANASELDVLDAFGDTLYTAPGYFGMGPFNFGGYRVTHDRLPLTVTTLAGYPGGRLTLNYSYRSPQPAGYATLDARTQFQTTPGDVITVALVGTPELSGLQYLPGGYLTVFGIDTDLSLTRWS